MLSTKDIYVKICNTNKIGHQLTDDELKILQSHLMKMYRDLEDVCKRHNLNITLAYGNVLGALRHKGWIPWDDDLDVHMPRKDYDLLLSKYAQELPPQYVVYAPHTPQGPIYRFAKIIDTTPTFVQLGEENKPYHQGVFIDIFPIENISTNRVMNMLRKLWSYFLMYTATSVDLSNHTSKIYKQIMYASLSGKLNFYVRKIWGTIFSFASAKKWYCWIDNFHRYSKETGYVHIPTSVESKPWHPIKKSMFFPGREVPFGHAESVLVPGITNKDTEDYLVMRYGEWRVIPSPDKIWHHYVNDIDIPSES